MFKITKEDLETRLQDKKLEDIILNYEEYTGGYVDSIYRFIVDRSVFYVASNDEVEGLDFIVDHLESEGLEGWFIEVGKDNGDCIIDNEGDTYYYDQYIIGGDHGRYLYHGGNFRLEELDI